MDDVTAELNERFAPPSSELPSDVLGELRSILRVHDLEPEELFYQWDAYSIKMGADDIQLDLRAVRNFKRHIQEALERENREKQAKASSKKAVRGTPRGGGADNFDMMEGIVPSTPRASAAPGVNGSTVKRRSNFETPMAKINKNLGGSSPREYKTPAKEKPFHERANAGQIIESLNSQLEIPEPPQQPPSEPRVKLKSNTELPKFNYKTNAMKLSETSEVLDDRIDEFVELVKSHHELEDGNFGNAAAQGTSEIVAVGRIACDSAEGRLNAASIVLETSRRGGGGLRVPLKVDDLSSYTFFPGQIVALRGTNASGEFFAARELLALPFLKSAASLPAELDAVEARLRSDTDSTTTPPLSVVIAAGPFTTSSSLDFSPLQALLDNVFNTKADVLILNGPFLDTEHPAVRTGSFELPQNTAQPIDPDTATLTTVFQALISAPLAALAAKLPSLTIIVSPSVRDAVSRHAAFPQDRLPKRELGLPKQASCVTNPVSFSVNEALFGICAADPLDAIRRSEVSGGAARSENMLTRLSKALVEQRSFFPLFPPPSQEGAIPLEKLDKPVKEESAEDGEKEDDDVGVEWLPVGTMMDPAYLKLAEWLNVRPDVLVVPSVLTPFAKVVDSVIVINPGTLSKRRGPGTFARLTLYPAKVSEEARESDTLISHEVFERARVDIVRI